MLFSEAKTNFPMGIVAAREGRTAERDVYTPLHARSMVRQAQASPDGKWVLIAEMSTYGNWDQCRVVPMDGSSQGRQNRATRPLQFRRLVSGWPVVVSDLESRRS